jgi:hypothetical protein
MPDLVPDSTPPAETATPPAWDPKNPKAAPFPWEEHPAFRETFLLWFTRPEDRAMLEALGRYLYEMALEVSGDWPPLVESTTRAELRAVAKDLRHAQAFLLSVYGELEASSLQGEDERLAIEAGSWAEMVGRIATGMESCIWPVRFTEGSYYP